MRSEAKYTKATASFLKETTAFILTRQNRGSWKFEAPD